MTSKILGVQDAESGLEQSVRFGHSHGEDVWTDGAVEGVLLQRIGESES